ncbi:succinylglutamate desuccinylase/aspartoacylase family protein [Gracilimonas sp.]|uniref:succinylglutamate desuccinylase/aspartoacylase family protein n=1 Tax=Gracilimonas sp. TaxID=1974203 RepID=UPI002871E649|nr:succinylglutamate desuccinylase/aspartoacylase family protein [Gracilimonas sp.]
MQSHSNFKTDLNDIERIIWSHESKVGPIIVVFAGIHGNELAGVHACENISEEISGMEENLQGSLYLISGNQKAIKKGVRYLDRDLNRIWNDVTDQESKEGQSDVKEWEEAVGILQVLNTIIEEKKNLGREIYFIDLHTTSAESCAFILFNDTLENRKSASLFPVPQILGIEETIHGTLLSFINDLGYPAIGFEAGSHTDPLSVRRIEAFLWLFLHFNQLLKLEQQKYHEYESTLRGTPDALNKYYEITCHYFVNEARDFTMKKGYQNFDPIQKGELLAYDSKEPVYAPTSGLIFMPLYQSKGNDGFFILKGRSPIWLEISVIFRDSIINRYLHLLPGVEKLDETSFVVDLKVARFFVKNIFHLLGYRVIKKDEHTLICYKR